MLRFFQTRAAFLLMMLALASCAHPAPVENVTGAPIPTGTHRLSSQEIGNLIAKAAIGRGWTVSLASPGRLHARIERHDTYVAEVDITYSTTAYNIELASSQNLDYSNGKIDAAYNRYIDFLKGDIDKKLNEAVFN